MAVEFEHDGGFYRLGQYRVSNQLFIDLIFNSKCNCACPFCIANTKDFAEEDFDKWKVNLYKTFNIFKIKDIIILGGEATIDRRFFEKLEILQDVIKDKQIDNIILTTNGIMLKNEKFLSKLISSCVTAVNISIMHYGKTKNDKIFRASTLTREQLKHIYSSLKNAGKGMRINCNVYKGNCDNAEEMEAFVKYFSGCADAIKFSPLMGTDMFDTRNEITEYTNRVSLSKEEIFKLYDEFAQKHDITKENKNVFGLVQYKKLKISNQDVILKYQQVEDKYDLDREIPTLKIYPNGNVSNEWNYRKNILFNIE